MKKNNPLLLITMTSLGILSLVVASITYLTIANTNYPGGIPTDKVIIPIIAILASLGIIILLISKYKDIKSGQPLNDEMTKTRMNKAGNVAFLVSIYLLIFISVFSNGNTLFGISFDISSITGLIIFLMAIIYGISYLVNKKD